MTTTQPAPGTEVRVLGRPRSYVVIGPHPADADLVLVARPSRKHPGDYVSAPTAWPLDFVEPVA